MSGVGGDQLAAAILTRRLRKCIAEGAHPKHQAGANEQTKCPRCGIAPAGADGNGS